MPSTREPIQLLEPSDLLEPLDLTDHRTDAIYGAYSQNVGTSPGASAGTNVRRSPSVRRGSGAFKSALIAVGALGCFGAGAALPDKVSWTGLTAAYCLIELRIPAVSGPAKLGVHVETTEFLDDSTLELRNAMLC